MINEFYLKRVNNAIDFIEENLSEKIRLEQLASVAFFSKYHFHRIFKSVTGETLNNYIKRIRMEKAGKILQSQKSKAIGNVAFALGYKSIANFSRDFSDYYDCSPTEFRQYDTPVIEIYDVPNKRIIYRKEIKSYS